MKLISWNVNGLRSAEKPFLDFVESEQPDILMLQEVRAFPDQLSMFMKYIPGYESYFNPAEKPGYSGTAVYYKTSLPVDDVTHVTPDQILNDEGRTVVTRMGNLAVINFYTPNGTSSAERLQYKLRFYDTAGEYIDQLRNKGLSVVIGGDLNVAHTELDLYNPADNKMNSGFLESERAWFQNMLDLGFKDSFRLFEKNGEHYSWWHMRDPERKQNRGWRFDYFLVSDDIVRNVTGARILRNVFGSDHCPVVVEVKI